MKKQIKDLELWEIDYLVGKAEGLKPYISENNCFIIVNEDWKFEDYSPTTNPSQAWPIIESERVTIEPCEDDSGNDTEWLSIKGELKAFSYGKTSLEAAMRCFVASKFGDEVDIDDL